jgi:hypothetical protein
LDDQVKALAVDQWGNTYVTGVYQKKAGSRPFPGYLTTIKYNEAGEKQWVSSFPDGDGYHHVADLVVDISGNVYVTFMLYFHYPERYITLKYDASGVQQWSAEYSRPWEPYHKTPATALVSDDSGNIYITGSLGTIKYSPDGLRHWVSDTAGVDIAVDQLGNVFVSELDNSVVSLTDYTTIKYNTSGIEQWTARYNGPANSFDRAVALEIDQFSDIYVTGTSWNINTGYDYATVKYNSDGSEQWVARYNGPGDNNDHALMLALDDLRNVYIMGKRESSDDEVYTLVKYNSDGIEQWIVECDYKVTKMEVDGQGYIYVIGQSEGMFITVKYSQTGMPVQVVHIPQAIPKEFSLQQNYPNPFNPTTTIAYDLPQSSHVRIAIYDILGRHVRKLIDTHKEAGHFQVLWDGTNDNHQPVAAGIYFCRMEAGDFTQAIKLALVK